MQVVLQEVAAGGLSPLLESDFSYLGVRGVRTQVVKRA
jgi:hypothetical protein